MTDNDRLRFASLMKALGETYENRPPSKEKIELYFRVLSDLTIEQVDGAIVRLLRERTITSTFPVPGEIRSFLPGVGEDAAILALDKVDKAAQKWGAYHTVCFDDPVIHATISALGGWIHVASAIPEDQWKWFAKDFIKTYKAFASNPRAEIPRVLVGIWEGQDCAINNKPMETIYIGDKQKAIEWSEQVQEEKALSRAVEMADAISNKLMVR